jgi:hypothetical protein
MQLWIVEHFHKQVQVHFSEVSSYSIHTLIEILKIISISGCVYKQYMILNGTH